MKKHEVIEEIKQMIRDLESTKELYEEADDEAFFPVKDVVKDAWNILDELYSFVEEENK